MRLNRRRFLTASCAAFGILTTPRLAWSAISGATCTGYRPLCRRRANDLAARIIAQGLSDQLGKQFYVENIGGAGGNIGAGQASKAAADGYTIFVASPSYAVNPTLFETVPYDFHKSFDAVTLAATAPTVLTVHPSVQAKTVKELVTLIKNSPGKFSYASPGVGTPPHLLGGAVSPFSSTRHRARPVQQRGSGDRIDAGRPYARLVRRAPARRATRQGREAAGACPYQHHHLSSIARDPEHRRSRLSGDRGRYLDGFLVPAGTPRELTGLLQREIAKLMAQQDVRERLASLGYQPVANSSDECAAHIGAEYVKWRKVIREAGIKA